VAQGQEYDIKYRVCDRRRFSTISIPPRAGVSLSTLAYEYHSGFIVSLHAHGSDQLIYAISEVMEVSSGNTMWTIPPQFAVWIPARTSHSIHLPRALSMRTIYLRSGLVRRLRECSPCCMFRR